MTGWRLLINGSLRIIWPADYHSATIAARSHQEAGYTVQLVSPGGVVCVFAMLEGDKHNAHLALSGQE